MSPRWLSGSSHILLIGYVRFPSRHAAMPPCRYAVMPSCCLSAYPQETHRIHRDPAVLRNPMKMGPGHASRSPHPPDQLSFPDRVAGGDQHLAHVEVRGGEPGPVIHEHAASREVEIADEHDDAVVRRGDRVAHAAVEVEAQVPVLENAVEYPASAERAGDPAAARLG